MAEINATEMSVRLEVSSFLSQRPIKKASNMLAFFGQMIKR